MLIFGFAAGHTNGIGTISGSKALRALARAILREVPAPKPRKRRLLAAAREGK